MVFVLCTHCPNNVSDIRIFDPNYLSYEEINDIISFVISLLDFQITYFMNRCLARTDVHL